MPVLVQIMACSVDSSHKGPVMPSFDFVFVISLNKLLNKQSSYRWCFYAMTTITAIPEPTTSRSANKLIASSLPFALTHLTLVMHICVSELGIIGLGNGLSPVRRQAITWTTVVLSSIGLKGTKFSKNRFGIYSFSFTNMHLKMSSAKWRPFCPGGGGGGGGVFNSW